MILEQMRCDERQLVQKVVEEGYKVFKVKNEDEHFACGMYETAEELEEGVKEIKPKDMTAREAFFAMMGIKM